MTQKDSNNRQDLTEVRTRVKQKRYDYIKYDFSRKKNDILKTTLKDLPELRILRGPKKLATKQKSNF